MDDKRLESKLDIITEHISDINVTLGKQSVILDEHIRRTNILEKKLEPVEKHVQRIEGALKLLSMLALIAVIVEAALKAMGK